MRNLQTIHGSIKIHAQGIIAKLIIIGHVLKENHAMMPRIFGLLTALAMGGTSLISIGSNAKAADTQTLPALTQQIRPVSGGWFREHNNLGNVNFDISDSGVVAGNWSTYRNGKPIWYYFQGAIQYKTFDETLSNGVIATAELPLLEIVTGGPCLTCDFAPPTFNQNGSIKLEFTSTRTAQFIHNNSAPVEVVAWMQGTPLFANRDYAGEWVVTVSRRPSSTEQRFPERVPFQSVVTARLEPLTGPEDYALDHPSNVPTRPNPIEPGARRYLFSCLQPRYVCEGLETRVFVLNRPCLSCIQPSRDFMTLFFNSNDVGEFVGMSFDDLGSPPVYWIDDNERRWMAYGSDDKISIRYTGEREVGYGEPAGYTLEIEMHRLPTGYFTTASEPTP